MSSVRIYTRKMCGFCSAAINLLKSKNVAYEQFDASYDAGLRRKMISEANGRTTFPQIFIGEHHVGGCDELFALESSGKLDVMLGGE